MPITRLKCLAQAAADRRPDLFSTAEDVLGNIFIHKASTPEEVQELISDRLPNLMASHNIGLIALDSIAAPIRYEHAFSTKEDSAKKADLLLRIGAMLKTLCHKHACPCIVSNQVVDLVSNAYGPSSKIPALGLAWAVAVNTRLFLFRAPQAQTSDEAQGPSGVREVR
eukprot:CAMPEP_0173468124 /NCGR_PEP_ID=MMETSP1357-20121228/76311_1 /TAXON_ID=77926 /ORGANISM="Hemiselmis rufescens, Strain PCC563" /LENGTH=167 /DNA_ID=CAMNT_0014436315 /DNA_START=1 /DNA_END=501 /DNA_ORIENTATION=+